MNSIRASSGLAGCRGEEGWGGVERGGAGRGGRPPPAVGGLCYSNNNCSLDMKGVELMGAASHSLTRTTQLPSAGRAGEERARRPQ